MKNSTTIKVIKNENDSVVWVNQIKKDKNLDIVINDKEIEIKIILDNKNFKGSSGTFTIPLEPLLLAIQDIKKQ